MIADNRSLTETIKEQIHYADKRYHQLVLIVMPCASDRTDVLVALSEKERYPYINVSLVLSQALLDYSRQERILRVIPTLEELVSEKKAEVVLLDNIEILFEPSIRQDPLRCLEYLSRKQIIVATWHGTYANDALTYAESNHPEHKLYSDVDALVISLA